MPLADLASRPASPDHKQCATCWLLSILEPPLRDDLLGALANPAVKYVEIAEALADEGHVIAVETLRRHARGRCSARTKMRGAA